MEATGLGMTGEEFKNYYEENKKKKEQAKYSYSGKTGSEPEGLKAPTTSMYDAIDKLFSPSGEGVNGLEKFLDKYDWEVYDKEKVLSYINEHYADDEGVSDLIAEELGNGISNNKISEYIDNLNGYIVPRYDQEFDAIEMDENGKYTVANENIYDIVKYIFSDTSLNQEQQEYLIYDILGISEEQVRRVIN